MSRIIQLIWLTNLAFIVLLAGCNNPERDNKLNTSSTELGKYMSIQDIPFESVQWELATIPDTAHSSVPGPTDYVSLIALVKTSQKTEQIENLPPTKSDVSEIPSQFILKWLPSDASHKLSQIGKTTNAVKDATGLLLTPAKRAYAIETKDGLLFYVEYVSP